MNEGVVISKRRKFSDLSNFDGFEYICESQKMNEEVVSGKRRKGDNDTDVGASASYTELVDQLAAIQASMSATKSREVLLSLQRQLTAIRERVLYLINTAPHWSSISSTTFSGLTPWFFGGGFDLMIDFLLSPIFYDFFSDEWNPRILGFGSLFYWSFSNFLNLILFIDIFMFNWLFFSRMSETLDFFRVWVLISLSLKLFFFLSYFLILVMFNFSEFFDFFAVRCLLCLPLLDLELVLLYA